MNCSGCTQASSPADRKVSFMDETVQNILDIVRSFPEQTSEREMHPNCKKKKKGRCIQTQTVLLGSTFCCPRPRGLCLPGVLPPLVSGGSLFLEQDQSGRSLSLLLLHPGVAPYHTQADAEG